MMKKYVLVALATILLLGSAIAIYAIYHHNNVDESVIVPAIDACPGPLEAEEPEASGC